MALAAAYEDGGVEVMTTRLRELEEKLRDEARKAGRTFLGVEAIRQQKWSECPDRFAKRRGLKPRVATRNQWKRIEALLRNLGRVLGAERAAGAGQNRRDDPWGNR